MKIEELLTLNNEQIIYFMNFYCKDICSELITDNENYWYLPGDSHIVLVSHVDTMRKGPIKLIEHWGVISNTKGILGADDRAGVFACFELHKRTGNAVLFTNFEESGGRGVKKFIKDFPNFFENTRLFLEIDRQGHDEYVSYTYLPKSISEIIETVTEFKEDFGTYSDIYDLSKYYKIPAINVAAGFYNEHTTREMLDINVLNKNIDLIEELLQYEIPLIPDYNPYKDYNYYNYEYLTPASTNNYDYDYKDFNSSFLPFDINKVVNEIGREYFLTQHELDDLREMIINSKEFISIIEKFIVRYFLSF